MTWFEQFCNMWQTFWHEYTCVGARAGASDVFHGPMGRCYECGCGFGVFEVYAP